jgi:AmmeMemoRadiSam system protein B
MGYRKPDLAGSWYPGEEKEIKKTIEGYIRKTVVPEQPYRGIGGIVPHAGWYFSGQTAFSVFYSISKETAPSLVWLFGMHLPPHGSNYIFIDEGYETPLGKLPVHEEAAKMMYESFAFVGESYTSYMQDNTVEVQLPFVKHLFPEAAVVTVGVSPTPRAVEIGKRAYGISKELGETACFIGSTDLTHYGPNYAFSPHGRGPDAIRWVTEENDKKMVDALLAADEQKALSTALENHNACCPGAVSAAIGAVKAAGVKNGVLVRYMTSYDVRPDASFVGYAGVVY